MPSLFLLRSRHRVLGVNAPMRLGACCFAPSLVRASLVFWATVFVSSGKPAFTDTPPVQAEVERLVRQLDAADSKERDGAEKRLAESSPKILEWLPAEDDETLSAEQRLRLGRLRPRLEEQKAREFLQGSAIRLDRQPVRVRELIDLVAAQTSNRVIDLRADLQQSTTDHELNQLPKEIPFWSLMDQVEEQTGLVVYPNQEGRAIGWGEGARFAGPQALAGPMRLRIPRVLQRRDFRTVEAENDCVVELTMEIEPRVRPLQIQIGAESISAVDNAGDAAHYLGPERLYLTFEGEGNFLETGLRFRSPSRTAQQWTEICGTVDLVAATEAHPFVFKDVWDKKDVAQKRSEMQVTFREVDHSQDGVWGVGIRVDRPAVDSESYLEAELRNEVFLEAADGRRFSPEGGVSSQNVGEGRTEYEYVFVDVPGALKDYQLLVRVPGAIVKASFPFKFRDIKLP